MCFENKIVTIEYHNFRNILQIRGSFFFEPPIEPLNSQTSDKK